MNDAASLPCFTRRARQGSKPCKWLQHADNDLKAIIARLGIPVPLAALEEMRTEDLILCLNVWENTQASIG